MKLKDLTIGQNFKFINGNNKTWEKLSNNGNITEYNYCRCIDDLLPEQRKGRMLISGIKDQRINKEIEVIII